MMVATLALLAAGVVVLLLLVVVVALRRRLRQLATQVQSLKDLVERGSVDPDLAIPPAQPRPTETSVALITGLRSGGAEPAGEPTAGRVVSVTLAGPMIKVAAFAHGVRRALSEEQRMRIGYAFRRELRRQRKMRRRAAATGPRQADGWQP